MTVALNRPMGRPGSRPGSREDVLLWADVQEASYEFDGMQPVAMTGGPDRHGTVGANLTAQPRIHLRGPRCRSTTPEGVGIAPPLSDIHEDVDLC